jgi:hypothetical protein
MQENDKKRLLQKGILIELIVEKEKIKEQLDICEIQIKAMVETYNLQEFYKI